MQQIVDISCARKSIPAPVERMSSEPAIDRNSQACLMAGNCDTLPSKK